MPVPPGTRFGPHEIIGPVGAGGMGEVYRARDTRLGRDVAIKVLPADVATDADRRARFEREARAVAALSHPNILALFDIGTEGDTLYVVTELLTGETLADRLRGGALPVRKAVEIAIAIARGLGAAHEKGIAHRDLKPANVFLLGDGQVKLLDFGLARETSHATPGDTTTQQALTDPGTVLGTVGYMAPEQVRGLPVDGRADLFALGVVLYEMLTGQRAFARESAVEALNAILRDDPPELASVRADLPPALSRIVAHALEKNPGERFQSARDVAFALEPLVGGGPQPATSPEGPSRATGARSAWALAAVATIGLIAALLWPRQSTAPATDATFLALGAPFNSFFWNSAPAISPDGSTIAFWAPNGDGRVMLWVRELRRAEARVVPDTMMSGSIDYALAPVFSPDSRQLAFFHERSLKKASVEGGSPQTLAEAPSPRGVSWGVIDEIVYQPNSRGPLFVVHASGGTPRPLPDAVPPDDRRGPSLHPSFLPDGRHFLFTNYAAIFVASIDGGAPREVVATPSRAQYANGYLLYVKEGSLLAQPFDLATRSVTGEPRRVVEKVGASSTSVDFAFSAASNGTLAYWEGQQVPLSELVWIDRTGRRVGTLGAPAHYWGLSASGDLARVAVEVTDPRTNWVGSSVFDVRRGTSTRIALDAIDRIFALTPVLSRDGRHLWFSAYPGVFQATLDGGVPSPVGDTSGLTLLSDVSPDGQSLVYVATSPKTLVDIWVLPLTGDRPAWPWLQSPAVDGSPRFSSDGRWLAYVQDDGDGPVVYIDAFPARGRRERISSGPGRAPMWSHDGTRLFYLTLDNHLMEVRVKLTSRGFDVAPPSSLFAVPAVNGNFLSRMHYWPGPDGRFLFNVTKDNAMPRTVNVVVNWLQLVQARS